MPNPYVKEIVLPLWWVEIRGSVANYMTQRGNRQEARKEGRTDDSYSPDTDKVGDLTEK